MSSMSRVLISTGMLASICIAASPDNLHGARYRTTKEAYEVKLKHGHLVLCKLKSEHGDEFWYPGYEYTINEIQTADISGEEFQSYPDYYGQSPFLCSNNDRHVQTFEKVVESNETKFEPSDRCYTKPSKEVITIQRATRPYLMNEDPSQKLKLWGHDQDKFSGKYPPLYFDVQFYHKESSSYQWGMWCFKDNDTDFFVTPDRIQYSIRHSPRTMRDLKLRIELSEYADRFVADGDILAVVAAANSITTDHEEDDQKVEPGSASNATPDGEVTIQSPLGKFLEAQAALNRFFATTTPMHEKKSAGGFRTYQERKFWAEPDCFLVWKEKKDGAWVEKGRFDQNNIDWDHFDDGIVTRAGMGEKGFSVFALKNGAKKYKFRCKTQWERNEFAGKLDAVIRAYYPIWQAQTRRRLVSRPIKHLSQEISNRVHV